MKHQPARIPEPSKGTVLIVAGPHKGHQFPRGHGTTYTMMNPPPPMAIWDVNDTDFMDQLIETTTYKVTKIRYGGNDTLTAYVALPTDNLENPALAYIEYMRVQNLPRIDL